MRFLISLAALIASTTAAEIGVGYESLPSSGLKASGFLGLNTTFDGAGKPISPNPFQRITYSTKFTVFSLAGQLLIIPPSAPNVLLSPNIKSGYPAGSFSKITTDASFNARAISFACVTTLIGIVLPVPCKILFEGTGLTGNSMTEIVEYTGGITFTTADLDFEKLRGLSFAVLRGGASGNDTVSLLLDGFYYTLNDKPVAGRDFVA